MINVQPPVLCAIDGTRRTRTLENVSAIWVVAVLVIIAAQPLRAQLPQANAVRDCVPLGRITRPQFQSIMRTVAEGWNRGDAQLAASCFRKNAIYSGPPSAGHHGRQALYEYFGGVKGRELAMHMTWHHLVFDPVQQIGAGEFTFRYRKQTHGLVIVRIIEWPYSQLARV